MSGGRPAAEPSSTRTPHISCKVVLYMMLSETKKDHYATCSTLTESIVILPSLPATRSIFRFLPALHGLGIPNLSLRELFCLPPSVFPPVVSLHTQVMFTSRLRRGKPNGVPAFLS